MKITNDSPLKLNKTTQPTQPTQQPTATTQTTQPVQPTQQPTATQPTQQPRTSVKSPIDLGVIRDTFGTMVSALKSAAPKPATQSAPVTGRAYLADAYRKSNNGQDSNIWNSLSQAFTTLTQDRSSPMYAAYAYSNPTNSRFIQELNALGIDTSGGINQQFLDSLKEQCDFEGHAGVSGAPLAPTKKSTRAQNLAYWVYQLEKDEANTQSAENELAAMAEYFQMGVNKGMSDDEIIKGMDWKSYTTLAKMTTAAQSGVPMQLNRAVNYNDDVMYGMLWAARNGGGTGNPMLDAMYYELGEGNMLKEHPYDPAKDVTNAETYAPYSAPSSLFDGLDLPAGITANEFLTNGEYRSQFLGSEEDSKRFEKVGTALQTSEKAREDWAALTKDIDKMKERGKSPEEIWEKVQKNFDENKYPTLSKMEDARLKGKPLDTDGSVNMSMPNVRNMIYGVQDAAEQAAEQSELAPYIRSEINSVDLDGIKSILNGKTTKDPDINAWFSEYGWLFGGETNLEIGQINDQVSYDSREQRPKENPGMFGSRMESTGLPQMALDALKSDSEGVKGGYISQDEQIMHVVKLSEDMQNADANDMSLEEYYNANPEAAAKFQQWADQRTTAKDEYDKWKTANDEMQKAQNEAFALETYNARKAGFDTSTDYGRAMQYFDEQVQMLDVSDLMAKDDYLYDIKDQMYDAMSDLVFNAAYGTDYSNPANAYVRAGMTDIILEHAMDPLLTNLKYATAMGMTLDEFNNRTGQSFDPEEAIRQATKDFNAEYETDGLAFLASLAGEVERRTSGGPDYAGEGVGTEGDDVNALSALGVAAKVGTYEYLNGLSNAAYQYGMGIDETLSDLLYGSLDEYMAVSLRSNYASREEARAAIEQTIEGMDNEGHKKYWQDYLNSYTGDIYDIKFSVYYENLLDRTLKRRAYIDEASEHINRYGNGLERTLFSSTAALVQNAELLLQSYATGAVFGVGSLTGAAQTLIGSAATAITYGLPEGAETMEKMTNEGISHKAALPWGIGQAAVVGAMENLLGLDKFLGNSKAAKLFYDDSFTSLGVVGMLKNLKRNGLKSTLGVLGHMVTGNGISEGFQELVEYGEKALVDSTWQSIYADSNWFDNLKKNFDVKDMWNSTYSGFLMGMALGCIGADVQGNKLVNGKLHTDAQYAADQLMNHSTDLTNEKALEYWETIQRDYKENKQLYGETWMQEYNEASGVIAAIQDGALAETDPTLIQSYEEANKAVEAAQKEATEAEQLFNDKSVSHEAAEQAQLEDPSPVNRKALKYATDALAKAKEAMQTAQAKFYQAQTAQLDIKNTLSERAHERLEALTEEVRQRVAGETETAKQTEKQTEAQKAAEEATLTDAEANPTDLVKQADAEAIYAQRDADAAQEEFNGALQLLEPGKIEDVTDAERDFESLAATAPADEANTVEQTDEERDFESLAATAPMEQTSVPEVQAEAPARQTLLEAKQKLDTAKTTAAAARTRATKLGALREQLRGVSEGEASALLQLAEKNKDVTSAEAIQLAEELNLPLMELGLKGKNGVNYQISAKAKRGLTGVQRTYLRVLDSLGKDMGIEVVVREHLDLNGSSDKVDGLHQSGSNRIYVATDALDDGLLRAGVHEMVHTMKEQSGAEFGNLVNAVTEELAKVGIDIDERARARMAEYAESGVDLTAEDAIEEVVAETLPQVFSDPAVLKDFAQNHRSAFAKLKDWLDTFLEKVRSAFLKYSSDSGHVEADALINDSSALMRLYNAFKQVGEQLKVEEEETAKIKASLVHLDTPYSEALDQGDTEEARRILDEAATAAGYDTGMRYHGTKKAGFTAFDLSKMDDGSSIFVTVDKDTARSYADFSSNERSISYPVWAKDALDIAEPLSFNAGYADKLSAKDTTRLNQLIKTVKGSPYAKTSLGKLREALLGQVGSALERLSQLGVSTEETAYALDNFRAATGKDVTELRKAIDELQKQISRASKGAMRSGLAEDKADAVRDELSKINSLGLFSLTRDSELGLLLGGNGKQVYTEATQDSLQPLTPVAAASRLSRWVLDQYEGLTRSDGLYRLFVRPGNQLVFDAQGSSWRQLHFVTPEGQELNRTRELSAYAKANGYDSVRINNVVDYGDATRQFSAQDVEIYFNPADLKSADLATYDDEGNLIPPSERFSTKTPDLRYSLTRRQGAKSEVNIFRDLYRGMGVQMTLGQKGMTRNGQSNYNQRSDAAHIADQAKGGPVDYITPLEEKLGFTLRGLMNHPEIMRLAKGLDPSLTAGLSDAAQKQLAMSAYVHEYIYQPTSAQQVSPDFYREFESALESRGWLEPMRTAQKEMRNLQTQTAAGYAAASIDEELTPQQKADAEFARRLECKVGDRTYAVEKLGRILRTQYGGDVAPSEDPRTLLLANSNKGANSLNSILDNALVDPEGNVLDDRSLNDMLKLFAPADGSQSVQKLRHEINTYLVLLHARDRLAQGKAVNDMSEKQLNDAILEMQVKHPEFVDAAPEFQSWYDKMFRAWAVDTGIVPVEQYEQMRLMYPNYIPTFRTDFRNGTEPSKGGGVPGAGGTNDVLKATGSAARNVYNPILGLVETMDRLVSNYRSTEVGRAFLDAIRNTADTADIAEVIGTPDRDHMIRIDPDSTELLETFPTASTGRNVPGGLVPSSRSRTQPSNQVGAAPRTDLDEDVLKDGIKVFGDGIMTVIDHDGKQVSLRINDPLTAELLLRSGTPQGMSTVAKKMAWLKGLITSTATALSPSFAMGNAIGDLQTAIRSAGLGVTPIDGVAKWLVSQGAYWLNRAQDTKAWNMLQSKKGFGWLGTPSERYRLYELYGHLDSKYNFREKNTAKDLDRTVFGRRTVREVLNDFRSSPVVAFSEIGKTLKGAFNGYLDTVSWTNDNAENGTRYSQFLFKDAGKLSFKMTSEEDLASYDERLRRGRAARELTTDFSKVGSSESLRTLRAAIPFSGAVIQGINKSVMNLTSENEGKRGAMFTRLGEVAVASLIYSLVRNLAWDDDDKLIFDYIQNDYKMNYWIFPTGNGKFIRVRKSQDMLYQTAAMLGDVLGSTCTGGTDNPLSDVVHNALAMIGNATDLTTIFDPILDVMRNTTWYGTPINNYSDEKVDSQDRYDEDTSVLWRWASEISNALGIEMSPKDWEYLIRQYTGTYGTIGGKVLEQATEGKLSWSSFGRIISDRFTGRFELDGYAAQQATNIFYQSKTKVEDILAETKRPGKTVSALRWDLSQNEIEEAAADAKELSKTLDALAKEISNGWTEYYDTPEDDEVTRAMIRKEQMERAMEGNALVAEYMERYCYSNPFEQAALNVWNWNKKQSVPD